MTFTPEQIEIDRGAGTPGVWHQGYGNEYAIFNDTGRLVCETEGKIDASRIVRLPDLEDAFLKQAERIAGLVAALSAIELHGGSAETFDPVVSKICRDALEVSK